MEHIRRIHEGRDEWSRILGLHAKPEAGVTTEIGMGFMGFEANQANADVLGAGQAAPRYCLAASIAKRLPRQASVQYSILAINALLSGFRLGM